MGSVSGGKAEPASVTIEGRRTAVPVHLDGQHGAFHGAIPSWAGSIRQPALDRRLSLRTTDTTIMISRADGGRNEGILPVAEIMQRLVAETEAALSRAVDFR
jgi:hypothetical protein